MFDIGWSELLVIGALALIVVGPKDLPMMLRNIGRYVGKARSMAREFQRSMEDAAREADLGELSDLHKTMNEFNRKIGLDEPSKPKKKTTPKPASKEEEDAQHRADVAKLEHPPSPSPDDAPKAEPEASSDPEPAPKPESKPAPDTPPPDKAASTPKTADPDETRAKGA